MNKYHPLLIIFVKNPQLGKVKTRLAKSIGDHKALSVYKFLLSHTNQISKHLDINKIIYYTEFVDEEDIWDSKVFEKAIQPYGDLGIRMQSVFEIEFNRGYGPIGIIGSDCYQLNDQIIKNAFEALKSNEVVIGPASDGGYYFLGMQQLIPAIFKNKSWSTTRLFTQTINDLAKLAINPILLPELSDVDTIEDLNDIEGWENLL